MGPQDHSQDCSNDPYTTQSEPEEEPDGPNPKQRKLITSTEGTYLVDAGAGTGKTYTITRRYANIISQDTIEPEDVRLFTFTENAANEMRDRIVNRCEYDMAALRDAPIGTFHGICNQLLKSHGFSAPQLLGIDDSLSPSASVLSEEVLEQERFEEFARQYVDSNPKAEPYFAALNDTSTLLSVIRELAAKGVFPTADGWYRHSARYLDGDAELFEEALQEANAAQGGGSRQSDLQSDVSDWDSRPYEPDAPAQEELRAGGKEANEDLVWEAFHADRSGLQSFVHDLYVAYLEYALDRNYLTFWMQLMFAFVLLCENDRLRADLRTEYVMIDEFQDTNELQFKVALLFAGGDNFCVVGDWKQSIYGFQHAAVENILDFELRLNRYIEELNADAPRVPFSEPSVKRIRLKQNYRSTQDILDFVNHSLTLPATGNDTVNESDLPRTVTSLCANTDADLPTVIEAFKGNEENGTGALLAKIQHIVGNDAFAVESDREGEQKRLPQYDDIAVLTRVRRFGREFQREAQKHNIPAAFEGGLEIFDTDHAKLVLAWLRIADKDHSEKGWAVVLEQAGYTLPETKHILNTGNYPSEMRAFREKLTALLGAGAFVRRVFDRYGFDDGYTEALITTLEDTFSSTAYTRGDLIRFIENSMQNGSTVEVSDSVGNNAVTVQTIHAAKGLEYPIVIVANLNSGAFPPAGGSTGQLRYSDELGVQQTHVLSHAYGTPYVLPNWRYDLLSASLPTSYDEERRLLYVAMTRAEQHLLFSAGENPCTFFEELPLAASVSDTDLSVPDAPSRDDNPYEPTIRSRTFRTRLSAHDIMGEIETAGSEGKGMEFGQQVHDFAEAIAEGKHPTPDSADEQHVLDFLNVIKAEFVAEENAHLPLETSVGPVLIAGIIDLMAITETAVRVVDFKTDRTRSGQVEYRKQLSVYYHVLESVYPDREISLSLFYTAEGESVSVEPVSKSDLAALAEDAL